MPLELHGWVFGKHNAESLAGSTATCSASRLTLASASARLSSVPLGAYIEFSKTYACNLRSVVATIDSWLDHV
jgi:hypothetical protein